MADYRGRQVVVTFTGEDGKDEKQSIEQFARENRRSVSSYLIHAGLTLGGRTSAVMSANCVNCGAPLSKRNKSGVCRQCQRKGVRQPTDQR